MAEILEKSFVETNVEIVLNWIKNHAPDYYQALKIFKKEGFRKEAEDLCSKYFDRNTCSGVLEYIGL